jgi:preprotein translocase subunit SecG
MPAGHAELGAAGRSGYVRLLLRRSPRRDAAERYAMTTVLLIVFLFVTLALIGVILVQRSEGGGLGIGSSQGMGSFMTGRGTANLLTRTTAVLGTVFMVLALVLALLGRGTGRQPSLLDSPPPAAPAAPAQPAQPAVPVN